MVVDFNGQTIDSADSLVAAVRSIEPGSSVKLDYVRGGNTESTTVTLASVPSS